MLAKESQTIHICHLVEASGGGVLSVIKDSIQALQYHFPNKYQFTIIYSTRKDTPTNIENQFNNVNFIKIQMGSNALETTDFKVIFKLRNSIKEFDIVHMHSSRAGFLGRIALITIFKKRPRSFYSPHCFGFLNLSFSKNKRKLIWFVEYILSKTPNSTIIACGPTELELAKKITPRSALVTNGYFSKTAPYLKNATSNNNELIVAGSGRNSLQKDPEFFKQIAAKNKNEKIRLKWIGNIDYENATGWLTREEAFKALENCDVFLATSLWEGLPVNGIEAMSLGKPILARNTSSYTDLVEHGLNGFIYETIEDALKILETLFSNRSYLNTLSNNARDIAMLKFSISNYLELDKIYLNK